MKKVNINALTKAVQNYIEHSKYVRGLDDSEHWSGLCAFIEKNQNEITDFTWYDAAGGFMVFYIEMGSTFVIGNDLFDGEHNTIEYDMSLKSLQALESDNFDLDLLPQKYHTFWGGHHSLFFKNFSY